MGQRHTGGMFVHMGYFPGVVKIVKVFREGGVDFVGHFTFKIIN